MNRVLSTIVPAVLLVALLLAAVACGPGSPEERIVKIRSEYTIELNSWQPVFVEDEAPMEDMGEEAEATEDEGAAEDESAAEEEADEGAGDEMGEEGEEAMAAGPQPKDYLFDLVIYFKGRESLPGVTVDLVHFSANEERKAVFRQYIETQGIVNGETRQADFVLEDLIVEEGDGFAADVVSGVPADISLYREFSESGS